METTILGLLAESAIHAGAGRSAGIIDLPIAREAATEYPFIPGSSIKGALLDRARRRQGSSEAENNRVFGTQNQAGQLLISDARMLLLPVRCLTGTYRWVTCPQILERYRRDLQRCGMSVSWENTTVPAGKDVNGVLASGAGRLYLEERELAITGACPAPIIKALQSRIRHPETAKRLTNQLAIVSDDDMAWFCRYAIPLQVRNVLDKDTKVSTNLWHEESLPTDSVLYTLAMARDSETRGKLKALFPDDDRYLQLGGNETVGHGWFAVQMDDGGKS
jgi:CRISPR-associated protein Cmr4